jgi:CheY-like chemotaxis protein
MLEVDPLRISQALSNLLNNAAKYTDAGGQISLSTNVTSSHISFCVADSGIGIDGQTQPRLFEMFSQVESAIDRAEGGLGIGLALVKGLVALHGGTVDVDSAGLGRGSRFTMRLPATVIVTTQTSPEDQARPSHLPAAAKRKVLIADDNRDAAQVFALVLQASGYGTCIAHSGIEALEVGQRERPEVVILDIGMPGMNGYDVAQRFRAEDWGRDALILAVTGWGHDEDRHRAKAAGFDHHFTKPADIESVLRIVAEFFDSRIKHSDSTVFTDIRA